LENDKLCYIFASSKKQKTLIVFFCTTYRERFI